MKRLVRSLAVGLAVVLLASCAKSGPVTLSLANSQSRTGEVRMSLDENFQEPNALPVDVEYKVRGVLPYLGDRLLAWSIGRRVKPSGELEKLAFSFGVRGDTEKVDKNSYLVTNQEKNKAINLWIDDAGGWWTYQDYAQAGASLGASSPSCLPGPRCNDTPVAPVPAKNLIEPGDALRRTNQYLSRADMVPLNYPLEARKTEFTTEVFGALTLGGVETNIGVSFSYGEDGVLLSASGPMITIAMAGRYPIVSPMEAVKRLLQPKYGAIGAATRLAADVAVSSSANTPGDSSQTTPTSIEVQISGVRLLLMEVRLSNGTHMLLPGYTFSNAEGDVGTVIAVDDDLLSFRKSSSDSTVTSPPITGGVPEPSPVEPAAISQADANTLIGLTEQEAVKTSQSKGWVVRIAARDGENFMLTTDFVTNRVNLSVEKNLVTSVVVG